MNKVVWYVHPIITVTVQTLENVRSSQLDTSAHHTADQMLAAQPFKHAMATNMSTTTINVFPIKLRPTMIVNITKRQCQVQKIMMMMVYVFHYVMLING